MTKPSSTPQMLDPNDPLFDSIEDLVMGLDPDARFEALHSMLTKTDSQSQETEPETEERDGKRVGELRLARWKHQNEQFRKKRG